MDQYEASLYNQAITLAKMGHREQAYSFFKSIAQKNPQDQNLVFWLAYTAPSLETSQDLLDQAYTLDPDNPALRQANQWLTNEKLNLPQPAQGFPLFPPANIQTLAAPTVVSTDTSSVALGYTTRPGDPYSYYPLPALPYASQTQPALPYYSPGSPQPAPYYSNYQNYQSQALAPYQPYPAAPAYPPYPSYSQYQQQQPYYPYQVPQNYARPYYPTPYYQNPAYYPPVRWGSAPANAYAYYLAMGHNYRCPYCNTPYPPINGKRISTSGWVTFAVLITLFFPLAWVGLLMQENYLRCSNCRILLT